MEKSETLFWHYSFAEEELDFIINYETCLRAARRQVKYRMGKALFGEDETEAEAE